MSIEKALSGLKTLVREIGIKDDDRDILNSLNEIEKIISRIKEELSPNKNIITDYINGK